MEIYPLFKSLAFKIDPERAHELTLGLAHKCPKTLLHLLGKDKADDRLKIDLGPLNWSFPIGLAAGLDKNAEAIDFFMGLDFGAIEVGTVTFKPQEGNPRPRLFRLPEQSSLRNRMGFNNHGAQAVLENVQASKKRPKVLGINIGKNKDCPNDLAYQDYQNLYEIFAPVADYLVINVSSPNTPGLRSLQGQAELKTIFGALEDLREKKPCPLFLKISPDLNLLDLEEVIQCAVDFRLTGLVATNTTIMEDIGPGGISGELLKERAGKLRHHCLQLLKETDLELIGVGGVDSFDDLLTFWQQGGKVMQLYTSFIYQGPYVLRKIKSQAINWLDQNNFKDLSTGLKELQR